MRFLLSALLLFAFVFSINAQSPTWKQVASEDLNPTWESQREIVPDVYRTVTIDFEAFSQFMASTTINKSSNDLITIPLPDGTNQQFEIEESTVFSAALASKYPDIKCFKGQGIDDPSSKAYFGYSQKGFHAMIHSAKNGTAYVDRYAKHSTSTYISYFRKDYTNQSPFECLVEDVAKETLSQNQVLQVAGDCQLRSYRLALACTGEYANFHGGTKESVLAEYAIAMSRVNGIYERDNGITMVLVGNTDEVIFLDAGSDPYTNNSGAGMLGENQETLDNIIGAANYDIGHVFSTGGGGIASLQSPCGDGKARGVTGLGSPVNDPFYVDYVCHEMGHQFGANHTQNNDCNRVQSTSMEPGSANTIMGYAGICAPNTANNSDDHFHAISIQEIANFITAGNGAVCAELIATDNTAPQLFVDQEQYNLPIGTPFVLTANGTDDDDDTLTYCWEQMDSEFAVMPPSNISVDGPAFLSLSPMDSPSRYFPNLNAILSNTIPTWEVIPFVSREMNFRCTVRDNNSAVGCTDEVNVSLDFFEDAGPFLVEYPNGGEVWNAGDQETVTWDVANTDIDPISCSFVDIVLSIDAGLTYEIVLASGVENNGSYEVQVPGLQVDFARIMIRSVDNVFFDVSDDNFQINTPFSVTTENTSYSICEGDDLSITLDTEAFGGFDEEITFSIDNLPGSTVATFTNNPINPSESTVLNLTNISGIEDIDILIVQVNTASISFEVPIEVKVEATEVVGFELVSPADGSVDMDDEVVLMWNSISGASDYTVTFSTDPGFNVIIAEEVNNTENQLLVTGLEPSTVYYWKVQVNNACAGNPTSSTFAFQTTVNTCESTSAEDLPIIISSSEPSIISSTIQISNISNFQGLNTFVDVDHSWVGDLIVRLISPTGKVFLLLDRPGAPSSEFGCNEDDFSITFDDASPNTAEDLENTCGTYEPTYQGIDAFSTLTIEDINGDWTLEIEDAFNVDGGSLVDWSIAICSNEVTSYSELKQNVFAVANANTKTIRNAHLQIENSDPDNSIFALLSLPTHGVLEMWQDGVYQPLQIGDFFTQSMIDDERIQYTHNGDDATMDEFRFDVVDAENFWRHDEVFPIIINQGEFAAYALLIDDIACAQTATGTIELETFGDCPEFMYSLDGINFQLSPIFNDLLAGTYTIIIEDQCNNVINSNEIVLVDPDELTLTGIVTNYDIEAIALGGSPNYTYSLDGINFQSSNTFTDIDSGAYVLYVMDSYGCLDSSSVTIDIEALIVNEVNITIPTCFDEPTGSLDVMVTGGIPPYQVSLDGENYQDALSFTDLLATTYTLYILDAGGFLITEELTINNPVELILDYTYENNEITINGSGGTGVYSYNVDGNDFVENNTFVEFPGNTFELGIQDENGCIILESITPLNGDIETQSTSCFGEQDGEINVMLNGGFPAYMYSLDNVDFQMASLFDNLSTGIYDIYVKDVNNNSIEFLSNEVVEPAALSAYGITSGDELTVEVEGGTAPFMYNFDEGSTFVNNNTIQIADDGLIVVTVRDANGCLFQFDYNYVGVKTLEEMQIRLYPNPMLDQLIFESEGDFKSDNTTIIIMNNLGQMLFSQPVDGSRVQIFDISSLPSGLYHVIVEDNNSKAIKKMVKF